ncbi:dynein regulatory complex subunit 4 isoform X2 [Archocentrus centrarchus]|uniref:dynein regulatory complex subunit 4 isoform X2 n=1 Tax=Archocentrus centrarchus TaxID=63155 RepID=UPI0011E9CFC2|nr:dynein regulatory complex subunit 4-like isoform X2 [Archocentrus centrarchus]
MLEEHIVRLREELNREREERNYFQLERDKINSFWEVTVRKQEEVEAELKKVDKDMEEAEARHQLDVKVYKQKIKHLQHEHLNVITELKSDSLAASEVLEKEQEQLEAELRKTIRVDIQELNIEQFDKELELKHNEEMTARRNHLEKLLTETTALCEKRMHVLQQDLDKVTKSQISDRESNWDSHIAALTKDHSKIYSNTEEFVAAMNTDADELTRFKDRVHEAKKERKSKQLELVNFLWDNKHLAEHISKIKEESDKIAMKLKHCLENKDVVEKLKRKSLKDLKSEHEILEQKFSKLQLERDELCKAFTESAEEEQHKDMEVEKKLQALTESLEKTEAQLSVVLSASNTDRTALSLITKKIEANIDSRNTAIKILQHKINLISTAIRCLLLNIEAKEMPLCNSP